MVARGSGAAQRSTLPLVIRQKRGSPERAIHTRSDTISVDPSGLNSCLYDPGAARFALAPGYLISAPSAPLAPGYLISAPSAPLAPGYLISAPSAPLAPGYLI